MSECGPNCQCEEARKRRLRELIGANVLRIPPTVQTIPVPPHWGDPRPQQSPEPDKYAPCPCGSGNKYKWCCWPKNRRHP